MNLLAKMIFSSLFFSQITFPAAADTSLLLTQSPSPPVPRRVNCDPSYPEFCLKPTEEDLDCSDLPKRKNFTVKPPDPHQFDLDRDGIGCET